MTGHVVHQPNPQHHCNPPEQDESQTLTFNGFDGEPVEVHPWMPNGTVWQCECGKRWRATYPYVNLFAPTWIRVRTAWDTTKPGGRPLWWKLTLTAGLVVIAVLVIWTLTR